MSMKKKAAKLVAAGAVALMALTACDDADVASRNLSKEADNFGIARQIVFYNGVTDQYMMTVEGYCAIEGGGEGRQLEVTCREGDGEYSKHFLGLSDNVTYFAEQIDPANVSSDHYKVTYKPTAVIPNLENTSGE